MTYKKFIDRFYGLIEISFCIYFAIISIFCTILMSILALADKEIVPAIGIVIFGITLLIISCFTLWDANIISLRADKQSCLKEYLLETPFNFIGAFLILTIIAICNGTFLLCFISWYIAKKITGIHTFSQLSIRFTTRTEGIVLKNFMAKQIGDNLSQGNWQKVVDECTIYLSHNKAFAGYGYYIRANAYYKLGDYVNALKDMNISIADFNKSIKSTKWFYTNPEVLDYQLGARYYTRAKIYYKAENFIEAKQDVNTAIKLGYNETACSKLSKDIEFTLVNKAKQNVNRVNVSNINTDDIEDKNKREKEDKPINIASCTKEELMSIGEFTKDKIDKFIRERDNGMCWYDLYSFCEYFEFQPHEMVELQGKLIFPAKPKSKLGRRVEV